MIIHLTYIFSQFNAKENNQHHKTPRKYDGGIVLFKLQLFSLTFVDKTGGSLPLKA